VLKYTKGGDLVIPSIAWRMSASDHKKFAAILFEIADEARRGIGQVVGLEKSSAASALLDVVLEAIARLEAEALYCADMAEVRQSLAKSVGPGRPKMKMPVVATNRLAALMLNLPYKKRRMRGRPKGSYAGPDPREIFTKVEAVRASRGCTITAAIDLIWPQYATILGHASPHQEGDAGKKRLSNLYYAGRRLVASAG
jgi:hypothetical protein